MDILIKNMEMPPEGKQICLLVMHNGTVWHEVARDMIPTKMEAISVPEHGDLIDRKALSDAIDKVITDRDRMIGTYDTIEQIIDEAETIVEASNGN